MINIKMTVTFTLQGNAKSKGGRTLIPTQVINMCEEAYQAMLFTPVKTKLEERVPFLNAWKKMPVAERISKHLSLMAHDLNAESFDYTVYND